MEKIDFIATGRRSARLQTDALTASSVSYVWHRRWKRLGSQFKWNRSETETFYFYYFEWPISTIFDIQVNWLSALGCQLELVLRTCSANRPL